jgi:hypothetical protein
MFTGHPHDALAVANARVRHLREEAVAERLRRASGTRRALAASLRSLADRHDPAPFAPRTA